jgi:lipoate-protein ligase A
MKLNILTFEHLPILEQLKLEEALLRTNNENWVILNNGSPKAIVMGISTKPDQVINLPLALEKKIPIIQRFSGGGTVIVDENTLFVTFIFQKNVHSFELFPKNILEWCFTIFKQSLNIPAFALIENDFTLEEKKVGGNAQYIKKDRFLHHTSFLWDFKDETMDCLLHPPKEPSYRAGRSHLEFITKLSPYISKKKFNESLISSLSLNYLTTLNPKLPSFPEHRMHTHAFYL